MFGLDTRKTRIPKAAGTKRKVLISAMLTAILSLLVGSARLIEALYRDPEAAKRRNEEAQRKMVVPWLESLKRVDKVKGVQDIHTSDERSRLTETEPKRVYREESFQREDRPVKTDEPAKEQRLALARKEAKEKDVGEAKIKKVRERYDPILTVLQDYLTKRTELEKLHTTMFSDHQKESDLYKRIGSDKDLTSTWAELYFKGDWAQTRPGEATKEKMEWSRLVGRFRETEKEALKSGEIPEDGEKVLKEIAERAKDRLGRMAIRTKALTTLRDKARKLPEPKPGQLPVQKLVKPPKD